MNKYVGLIFFLLISSIVIFSGKLIPVRAQSLPENYSITPTSTRPTPEELFRFRNKILDMFGISHNTPLTIYDFINGKAAGFDLPDFGTKPTTVIQGPLSDLELVLDSENLSPGQTVRAVAASFTTNLQNATIRWYQNDTLVQSGKGDAYYEFILGSIKSPAVIRVSVTAETGEHREITKTIHPSYIHLAWSADTYTPAWYRGKALPSGKSDVTVYAIPEFYVGNTKLNPDNLIYEWSDDGEAPSLDPKISGPGKNAFKFTFSTVAGKSYTITVHIHDVGNQIESENSITIDSTQPNVELYTVSSLYGEGNSLASYAPAVAPGESLAVIAEPFFIPLQDFAGLSYDWWVNNQKVPSTITAARQLRLTTTPESTGRQNITVYYQHPTSFSTRGGGSGFVTIQ